MCYYLYPIEISSNISLQVAKTIVSRAPVEVVDAEKAKLAKLEGQLTAMMEQLKAL
ncbi:hypothetical protein [Psychrobacter sp. JCM 18903]|uniref:hypothetical protein n=1 Tax=Psychrobacter sp. JCM 18903 TaxID=1298610 RepID=UPI001918E493|nr:hypothetical protein [Psychrobacter sp. JCM 18903]